MLIQTVFNFSSVVQRLVCRFFGLRLLALHRLPAFFASSHFSVSASSYCFCSAVPPRWCCAFSQLAPVTKSWLPVLASGSNISVKPTRLRRAAYFRSLANFPFNRLLQMRNLILITCATLILSACASPARYAWVKEGASDHQRTSDTSECTYQVRLNKTPTAEQKDLHSLCMQGKGYRLKRVG